MRAALRGLALVAGLLSFADASADQLVGVGTYCVSIDSHVRRDSPLRTGERPPRIAFYVSNRADLEDEQKQYVVAPLNERVFRALAQLSTDRRICLMASHQASRHGRDILFAWNLAECEDFACTNVPSYGDELQGPLDSTARPRTAERSADPE